MYFSETDKLDVKKSSKPPANSKIHVEAKENDLVITLPHRLASNWDRFNRHLAKLKIC